MPIKKGRKYEHFKSKKLTKSMRLTFTYIMFRTNITDLSLYMAENTKLEGE